MYGHKNKMERLFKLSLGDHIHSNTVEDTEDESEQDAVKSPDNEVKYSKEEAEYLPWREIDACHTSIVGCSDHGEVDRVWPGV